MAADGPGQQPHGHALRRRPRHRLAPGRQRRAATRTSTPACGGAVFTVSRTGLLAYQLTARRGGRAAHLVRHVGACDGDDRRAQRVLCLAPLAGRPAGDRDPGRSEQRHLDLRARARGADATDDERAGPPVAGLVAGRLGAPLRQRHHTIAGPSDYVAASLPSFGAGEKKVVFRSPVRIETTDWSRDGRYLLVDRGNIGATDIWAVELAQPDKPFPLVQTPVPRHDRAVLARRAMGGVTSRCRPGPGSSSSWRFPPGARPTRCPAAGGRLPLWSADGKTLYFIGAENELMAVDVDGSGPRFEIHAPRPLFPLPRLRRPAPGERLRDHARRKAAARQCSAGCRPSRASRSRPTGSLGR